MYGNIIKSSIRAYDSNRYSSTVKKLHQKIGITNSAEAIAFVNKELNKTICLGYIYDMLNSEEGT